MNNTQSLNSSVLYPLVDFSEFETPRPIIETNGSDIIDNVTLLTMDEATKAHTQGVLNKAQDVADFANEVINNVALVSIKTNEKLGTILEKSSAPILTEARNEKLAPSTDLSALTRTQRFKIANQQIAGTVVDEVQPELKIGTKIKNAFKSGIVKTLKQNDKIAEAMSSGNAPTGSIKRAVSILGINLVRSAHLAVVITGRMIAATAIAVRHLFMAFVQKLTKEVDKNILQLAESMAINAVNGRAKNAEQDAQIAGLQHTARPYAQSFEAYYSELEEDQVSEESSLINHAAPLSVSSAPSEIGEENFEEILEDFIVNGTPIARMDKDGNIYALDSLTRGTVNPLTGEFIPTV